MKDQVSDLLKSSGRGDVAAVEKIISTNVSVDSSNHVGGTALMSACASYRVKMVAYLLQKGADPNLRTNDGQTALHAAVGSSPSLPEDQRDCVRLLIDHGALVDVQDQSSLTPLMNAAWFGCTLAVIELLKAGASLELRDSQGRTALDLARFKERRETVRAIEGFC